MIKIIKEKDVPNDPYWFIQLKLDQLKSYLTELQQDIPLQNLYNKEGFGYETDSHITVLWGVTDNKVLEKVSTYLQNIESFNTQLGEITKFNNVENYDVIKIDVFSETLNNLHYDLSDILENEQTYLEYKPHFTLAYVLPNSCNHILGNHRMIEEIIPINRITVTSPKPEKKDYNFSI